MERIREAIALAKSRGAALGSVDPALRRTLHIERANAPSLIGEAVTIKADEAHLESKRVVAYHQGNPKTPAFDILRTKVLQLMDANDWQIIAVSSPTIGCGKTTTAINLALSIARMPGREVVLLDLDMRRPLVGSYLGINSQGGLFQLLSDGGSSSNCVFQLDVAGSQLKIIPNAVPVINPAEVISSQQVADLLAQLRAGGSRPIVVVDTPPMLDCDDVLALLPLLDCIVLTVAERISRPDEIVACEELLKQANYLGLVLTKSNEMDGRSYY